MMMTTTMTMVMITCIVIAHSSLKVPTAELRVPRRGIESSNAKKGVKLMPLETFDKAIEQVMILPEL